MNLDETIPTPFFPGNRTGKYFIIRELGRGGMGVVYLAEDTSLGRKVAIKVLRTYWPDDPEQFAERFRYEARAVAALNHPNIVRIHALDTIASRLAIDMEFVDSGSLADRLGSGQLSQPVVVRIGHDMLQALSQCHSMGIIHRDVKPSNVLIDTRGRARLTDFGLAKALSEHTEYNLRSNHSMGVFVGTPHYAPPEAWHGVEPTPAWDVYSVGMVLYESLTGSRPFNATSLLSLMQQVTTSDAPRVEEKAPTVAPELATLIHDMLDPDPETRVQNGSDALLRLQNVAGYRGPDTPGRLLPVEIPPPRKPKLRKPPRERKSNLPWLTATLVSLIVIAGVYFGFLRREPPALSEDVPVVTQESVFADTLPSPAELIQLSKISVPGLQQGFRVRLLERLNVEQRWLLIGAVGARNPTVLVYEDSHFAVLKLKLSEDRSLSLEGDWAQYDSELGNVFRTGKVSGSGFWPSSTTPLTAALRYVSEDGERWTWTVTGIPDNSITDTAFIYGFEESEWLQPLLYNEVLERSYAWAAPLEASLPCVRDGRAEIPLVNDIRAQVELDGALQEPQWQERHYGATGRIGFLPGRPKELASVLYLRWSEEGLLIGLDARRPLSPAAEIRLAVLPRFTLPTSASAQWRGVYRGGAWTEHSLLQRDVERPWDCRWEGAVTTADKRWQAEIFIPFANFEGVPAPTAGERWRINCSVWDSEDGSALKPVLQWGFPNDNAVAHAAVVEFVGTSHGMVKP